MGAFVPIKNPPVPVDEVHAVTHVVKQILIKVWIRGNHRKLDASWEACGAFHFVQIDNFSHFGYHVISRDLSCDFANEYGTLQIGPDVEPHWGVGVSGLRPFTC
jgi:hypothetical protein